MDQILNIYKPKGSTSFGVVAKVRKVLGVRKVGHAGTLDPLAEGVLIVLVGEATKKQNEFKDQEKEYMAQIAFGFETDTYDLEGRVLEKILKMEKLKSITKEEVTRTLNKFKGKISQRVPAYSAVKVNGKRLYKLARSGMDLSSNLPVREVEIKEIELISFKNIFIEKVKKILPVIEVKVVCSPGTYIRSLAHDLGELLGTGGTLISLIRTRIGHFEVKDSINLEELNGNKD